ncbi:unnamed protein product [Brassicogethes aeneus]|uniref:RRM domain-containing protein n=1 Tax=Brassicogethes aeneus TaxID=1431903 RepID=A0A9P0FPA9_BRAAE|nr:unnamed protein product [Brassicogethes aeneus]
MGEFSLSGNATNIGISAVEISLNTTTKSSNSNQKFYTTPSATSTTVVCSANDTAADCNLSTMQDEQITDKTGVSGSASGASSEDIGDDQPVVATTDNKSASLSSPSGAKDASCMEGNLLGTAGPIHPSADKLNEQQQAPLPNKVVSALPPLFHPVEAPPGNHGPHGPMWSTAIEDGYSANLNNLNGGAVVPVGPANGAGGNLPFQNYSSGPQQLYSNNMNQANQQGRRAITASHNFPHNMARQQSSHALYKGYGGGGGGGGGSWANPGQNWAAGNSSVWNRGRSVPNLTPLQQQQMGVAAAGRKPSPTFNQHQQVISPVKFRRSTSYPGKGPFPQPPTFEITNMDEARELLPYQDRCSVVNANGSSPLENMRGLEHYLNDIMRPQPDNDMKGFISCNPQQFQSLQLHGKYFPGLDDQAGPVLLEEPSLVETVLTGGNQPLSSPSRSSPHSQGSEGGERFSRKVFVGGLPPDIDEDEITASFRRFGPLVVDWPHKAESKSYFPPKGYAFLLFQDENSVQSLIDACITDEDKLYLCVSSPTIKDKPVQIRPWRLSDADFVLDASMPLDPRKTVFVGGVPRPLKAVELAMIMDRLYGGVCYAGIDTDPELKYPKGAGRVAFSNQQSYIAAISARFVQLQHGDIDKRVEVKPYVLDDQMCDECQGQRCGGNITVSIAGQQSTPVQAGSSINRW